MKNSVKKNQTVDNGADLRGTAYVTPAAKPFRTNGVGATTLTGGDLRVRNNGGK